MKYWGKILGLLLIVILSMAACGQSEEEVQAEADIKLSETVHSEEASEQSADTSSENEAEEYDEEPAEIAVAFAGTSMVPVDLQMVEDAINEISREKINVVIDLQCYTIGDYQQQLNMMLTSGEKLDLISTIPIGSAQFTSMCSQKQFMEINDLLDEYGQEIQDTVGERLLSATTLGGSVYGVPSYTNKAQDTYFIVRKDLVEKYGLEETVKNVKSVNDITDILEALDAEEGIVAPLGGKQTIYTNSFGIFYDTTEDILRYDTLGLQSLRLAGVATDRDSTKVINLYETDEYETYLRIIREWYEAGYIYKDAATYSEAGPALVTNNITAAYFGDAEFNVEAKQSMAAQREMVAVKIGSGMLDTASLCKFVWGIPSISREPEAAMKFLNLMYTDADIVNLLTWGIEGVHYEEKEDGVIGFLEGMTSDTCGYYLGGLDFVFGNTFLAKVWEGNDPDLRKLGLEAMEKQEVSPLLGFSVDTTNLENEITALTNAVNEYRYALECGNMDIDTGLAEFREKLKACGSEKYIEEVQSQLDEYLAN